MRTYRSPHVALLKMTDSAECARQKMAAACSITDADDEDGEKAHDSSSKSSRQLKRKRTATVVAPPPPLSVAYRVALDSALCAALVTHLVRFLLYFRGQIPW